MTKFEKQLKEIQELLAKLQQLAEELRQHLESRK